MSKGRTRRRINDRFGQHMSQNLVLIIIFLVLFLWQFYLIGRFARRFYVDAVYARVLSMLLDLLVSVQIVNDRTNDDTYKVAFLFAIVALPVIGAIFYLMSRWDFIRNRFTRASDQAKEHFQAQYRQDMQILEEFEKLDPQAHKTAFFLWFQERFPIYKNSKVEYFASGESQFEAIKRELRRAEHFIFLEYFIIQEGEMWDEIVEILLEKVAQGVEVRLLFDGTNMITKVPLRFPEELRKMGIDVRVFKPIIPVLTLYHNHRDHRKILVVDNYCAFIGGINLADEYINRLKRFGHWKDTGTLAYGKSVSSYTLMFLTMWNVSGNTLEDPSPYLMEHPVDYKEGAYIIPFGDDPYGKNRIGKDVYSHIINQATDYIHITTPYLILNEELRSILVHAAESGVDVKIITPHIPDKKLVFLLTRSNYKELLRGGVKIYEYTPGFIHAKSIVSDNIKSVVGSINLDYRSLYLHYECGSYYYDEVFAKKLEEDFQETLAQSQEFTLEMTYKFSKRHRVLGRILRVFAPMM